MTALDTAPRLPARLPVPIRGRAPASGAPRPAHLGALDAGDGPVQRVADASVWLLFRLSGVRS